MEINMSSIMNKVDSLEKSSIGKTKIINLSKKLIDLLCNDLIDCIVDNFPDSIRDSFSTIDKNSWIGSSVANNGYIEIDITIPPDLLKRESLLSDVGNQGINNIVALLNNGYHAKCYVYGYWKSKDIYTYSKKDREPLHFMQSAINSFNAKYGSAYGCYAKLDNKYN